MRYEYDAVGRLLYRVHLGEDDGGGNRPFIEYRSFLWEGNSLIAEAGYGSNDGTWDEPDTDLFLRWRKTYVPELPGSTMRCRCGSRSRSRPGPRLRRRRVLVPARRARNRARAGRRGDGGRPGRSAGRGAVPLHAVRRGRHRPLDEFVYDSIATASSTLDGCFPGGQNCLFQGLWTDPVTGIAYARNRWYDARTANWLSEDPKGTVDSTNLYAFVGWGPHVGRDPLAMRHFLNRL